MPQAEDDFNDMPPQEDIPNDDNYEWDEVDALTNNLATSNLENDAEMEQ